MHAHHAAMRMHQACSMHVASVSSKTRRWRPGTAAIAQVAMNMAMHGGMGMAMPGAPPTRVVALDEMLELNELTDQVTFDEIKEDMGDECSNFGASQ
jgi:hypothetical protein